MKIINVSEITRYIKQLLESDEKLVSVFIRGEISNFKQHYSGHCYFTLKDGSAVLRAVMFKSRVQFLKFTPVNGLKVIAGGRITIYERDGQYQLYVEQLVPEGMGELSLAYAQLKDKLTAEGLFAQERKRTLPALPKSVGIITSPTGAALRDIVSVSLRRHAGIKLVLYPVQVQGTEAPSQIVRAIEVFNTLKQVDVLIVGRGGGSLEELWAFNDERVVRAIAGSEIPLVSAVGHQTDFTLADFAADCRAATPSQAAEIVVPDVKELSRYVISLCNMLDSNITAIIKSYRLRLQRCIESRILQSPQDILISKMQALDNLQQRLSQAVKSNALQKEHSFYVLTEKLALLNPLSVLARGYSIVENNSGQVIKKANEVNIDDKIKIILSEGMIDAVVHNNKGGRDDDPIRKTII